ncbi:MAG: hypothetical protein ACKVU1_10605 [bacterium]
MSSMMARKARVIAIVAALAACAATDAGAGVPFPPLCTCTVTITQFTTRLICMTSWEPDVVRLTPAGSTANPLGDRAAITVRVRSATDIPVPSALVVFSEVAGIVNIANGGATTAITDAAGLATISLHAASGYGEVAVCADGIQLCRLAVRSPDVNKGGTPELCGLGTGFTSVNGAEINNPVCGFLTHFGPVTVGVNDGWDLNCDHNVSGSDITGLIGKGGGVLRYWGDTGTLGARNDCALP